MNTAPRKTGACSLTLFKATQPLFSVLAEEADILWSTDSEYNSWASHNNNSWYFCALPQTHVGMCFSSPHPFPAYQCHRRREPTQGEHRRDSPKIALHSSPSIPPECQVVREGRWCCTEPTLSRISGTQCWLRQAPSSFTNPSQK